MTIDRPIRAWLLLVPFVPSVVITIFNLYHFMKSRELRQALNNHVIILLLFCGLTEELTDMVWIIHFNRTGSAVLSTPAFCMTWTFFGSAVYISVFILMAWASIERHILIFYPNLMSTKRKRFLFHYLPLIICILWPVMFYLAFLIILPCDVPFKYNKSYCGQYACLVNNLWASWVDSILNYIMPAFITVVFSVALFVRVLYTRYRIQRRVHWRNHRKMTFQLLPISILNMTMNLPPMLMYAAYIGGLSWSIAADYYSDAFFFTFWVIIFTPFAISLSLPNLRRKCKDAVLFWRRNRTVGPQVVMRNRQDAGQTPAAVRFTR